MSTLKRMKARMQAIAAASKTSHPKNNCEFPEATMGPSPYIVEFPEKAPLNTRIQDRLKAIGACSLESVADTADPIPEIPISEETQTPDDAPTTPFDVHTTLLGRTASRYAAARAFNLGLPAPDREALVKLCDDIARREKQADIMWSLEGTYVPRGVPKGRVSRFVETGLLEVETGVEAQGGEEEEEEEDLVGAEKAALAVNISMKRGRGIKSLWKMRKHEREWGRSFRNQLIKA
ncbi:hypothetical protein V494_06611 [Pseudogymnoascus sp. VKM F-4513 (FW-928)]|nr:hypothetical protein V494_06611 [Pseudogymnoascus sp. VKM F-4513 (FW-928)]